MWNVECKWCGNGASGCALERGRMGELESRNKYTCAECLDGGRENLDGALLYCGGC